MVTPQGKDGTKTGDATSLGARLTALAAIVISLAVLAYYHRNDILPSPKKPAETGLNPEFVKCRDERTAQVTRMHTDGLIDDTRLATFTERAMAFCASKYPPDG